MEWNDLTNNCIVALTKMALFVRQNPSRVDAMRLKFKCPCGAKLDAPIRVIGRVAPCPACGAPIQVPKPPRIVVEGAMKAIPHVMPGHSLMEYAEIVEQIKELIGFNTALYKLALQEPLVDTHKDHAIRAIRNLAVYIQDRHEKTQDNRAGESRQITSSLASRAAGSNFGGVGSRKATIRSNNRWTKNRCPAIDDSRHPLVDAVFGLIESLRSPVTPT